MSYRVADVLARNTQNGFVGRSEELRLLHGLRDAGSPVVVFLYGIAGIGKTTLLSRFTLSARDEGVRVYPFDCGGIEPTVSAILTEFSSTLELDCPDPIKICDRLSQIPETVVLILDRYEVFRLIDTWLRQVFLPLLPGNVRLILSGQSPPTSAWIAALELKGLLTSIPLGPLEEDEALALLARDSLSRDEALRINRIARGHPLALTLAAQATVDRNDSNIEALATQAVVQALSRRYLSEIEDPLVRQSLEASAVIRRTTRSLLDGMLPGIETGKAMEMLEQLPFVSGGRDGLIVHDAVRAAIASSLQAEAPNTYRQYRRSAWRQLQKEVQDAGRMDLWRYTADMLYLIENPVVREAFFPSDDLPFFVEPAHTDDQDPIMQIAGQHGGPEENYRHWWEATPESFSVVRDGESRVVGFFLLFEPDSVSSDVLKRDRVTAAWASHLAADPVPASQRVLFLRRWLSLEEGEAPSPIQAACWLDVKRTYMEMRPALRRLYTTAHDITTYAPVVTQLGFRLLKEHGVELDGEMNYSVMLDFGPASVDGWLAGLVAAELGLGIDGDGLLDLAGHELIIDDERVHLTRLEYDVILYLQTHRGEVVHRSTLLDKVWCQDYEGGSNVVDVTVLSLRKKLGRQAPLLETVRGVGYRLRTA